MQRDVCYNSHETKVKARELSDDTNRIAAENDRARVERENANQQAALQEKQNMQELWDAIADAERSRDKADEDLAIDVKKRRTDITVEAFRSQLDAVSDELVAAVNADNDSELAHILAENLPRMNLGGMGFGMMLKEAGGIVPLLQKVLSGTGVEDAFQDYQDRRGQRRESE